MDISWEDTLNQTAVGRYDQTLVVYDATGKYPALKGFDFIQHKAGANPPIRQQTEEAYQWWNGIDRVNREWVNPLPGRTDVTGIVAFCWHWRGPGGTHAGFYAEPEYTGSGDRTTLKIPMIDGKLNKAHTNFAYIKGEIDIVIEELKWLQERGVPVIWRPLHEALGNLGNNPWFWWGTNATDGSFARYAFKALWEYMYDYMTIVHGLDNLIWLNNGQGAADNLWVPDRRTFHLTGYDLYPGAHVDESQKFYYDVTKNIDPTKMVSLSENGPIPNPDKCFADGAMWLFWMVWDRMFVQQNGSGPGSIGHTAYNHPRVITLDSLPNLKTYRLD
jgi:mannan endo-1,4-beta-mannosidase